MAVPWRHIQVEAAGFQVIAVSVVRGRSWPNARRFVCQSRFSATPRSFLFELNAEGTDYIPLPDAADEDFHQQWDILRLVLEDAPQKLTRQDILDEWPDEHSKPNPATLWKWLTKAVAEGLVQIEGAGRKTDPYRYWLAATEERWRTERPMYDLFEQLHREQNVPFQSLRERKAIEKHNAKFDRDLDRPLKRGEKLWPPGSEEE